MSRGVVTREAPDDEEMQRGWEAYSNAPIVPRSFASLCGSPPEHPTLTEEYA